MPGVLFRNKFTFIRKRNFCYWKDEIHIYIYIYTLLYRLYKTYVLNGLYIYVYKLFYGIDACGERRWW